MAKVHILNVTVHNNPAPFFTPFQFEIHFECLEELQDDLEFKIIYVGSAETYEFDQVLDQIVVDAVPQGQFKFMFQADPPNTAKIPADDAVGVTVALITASYRDQEFVRVGYYVTNEYEDMELRDNPPAEPQFNKLVRTIAANEPRVTKFKINWDSAAAVAAAAAAEAAAVAATSADAASVPPVAADASSGQDMMEVIHTNGTTNGASLPAQTAAPTYTAASKLDNKENMAAPQQVKTFNASDLKVASVTSADGPLNQNSNQFVESSFDSVMN